MINAREKRKVGVIQEKVREGAIAGMGDCFTNYRDVWPMYYILAILTFLKCW